MFFYGVFSLDIPNTWWNAALFPERGKHWSESGNRVPESCATISQVSPTKWLLSTSAEVRLVRLGITINGGFIRLLKLITLRYFDTDTSRLYRVDGSWRRGELFTQAYIRNLRLNRWLNMIKLTWVTTMVFPFQFRAKYQVQFMECRLNYGIYKMELQVSRLRRFFYCIRYL